MQTAPSAKSTSLALLALALLATTLAGAKDYMTPEFAKAEYRPAVVVLLPPRAEVIKQKTVSAEALI